MGFPVEFFGILILQAIIVVALLYALYIAIRAGVRDGIKQSALVPDDPAPRSFDPGPPQM